MDVLECNRVSRKVIESIITHLELHLTTNRQESLGEKSLPERNHTPQPIIVRMRLNPALWVALISVALSVALSVARSVALSSPPKGNRAAIKPWLRDEESEMGAASQRLGGLEYPRDETERVLLLYDSPQEREELRLFPIGAGPLLVPGWGWGNS